MYLFLVILTVVAVNIFSKSVSKYLYQNYSSLHKLNFAVFDLLVFIILGIILFPLLKLFR